MSKNLHKHINPIRVWGNDSKGNKRFGQSKNFILQIYGILDNFYYVYLC